MEPGNDSFCRVSGYAGIRVSGYPGIRVSGYAGYGIPSIALYMYMYYTHVYNLCKDTCRTNEVNPM